MPKRQEGTAVARMLSPPLPQPCGVPAAAGLPASISTCLQVAAAAPYAAAGWNPEAAASSSAVPEVLLGVVASDVRLAVRSLRDYCQALGLPFKVGQRGPLVGVGCNACGWGVRVGARWLSGACRRACGPVGRPGSAPAGAVGNTCQALAAPPAVLVCGLIT